jgi:hypothetical protein
MAETCNEVDRQTEEACLQNSTGGWTVQRREIRIMSCRDDVTGQVTSRTFCGDWSDTGKTCVPRQEIIGGGA